MRIDNIEMIVKKIEDGQNVEFDPIVRENARIGVT